MRIAFVTYRALPQLADDDRLAVAELRQHDIAVESAAWDSPLVDWSVYDALVIRSVWDYHLRPREFETWLAFVERLGVPLWNPAPLVRWKMDKPYLTTRARIDELTEHEAAFSSLLAERDVLVQPFMEQIVTDGEWSLVFFSGQYSHAVKKRASEGEFRVQPEHGGVTNTDSPRGLLVAQAEDVVSHVPVPWLYARVDVCQVEGALVLMELELVEPSLFLGYHASAPRRFAAALRQLLVGRRTPLSFTPRSFTPPGGLAR